MNIETLEWTEHHQGMLHARAYHRTVVGGANLIHLGGDHSEPDEPVDQPGKIRNQFKFKKMSKDADSVYFDTVEKWHWNGEDFDIVATNVTIPFTSQNYYEGFVTNANKYLDCFDLEPELSGDGPSY